MFNKITVGKNGDNTRSRPVTNIKNEAEAGKDKDVLIHTGYDPDKGLNLWMRKQRVMLKTQLNCF